MIYFSKKTMEIYHLENRYLERGEAVAGAIKNLGYKV
jgi:hypothetical protein